MITWIIDADEEPTPACYVDIPDDLNLKVLFICQDIVYLEYKVIRDLDTLIVSLSNRSPFNRLVVLRLNRQGQWAA